MYRDRRNARGGLKTALLGGAAATLLATAAMAQERPISFDIAAQDAGSALNDFSRQSGLRVLFPYDAVEGKNAPAVRGDMTADEALNTLLRATGLVVAANDGTTVTLTDPQSGSAAGDGAEGTVEALIVTAQKREEDIQDVPIAISAFTQEDLTRSQIAGGPDLMTQVPNMTFTKTNFTSYSIQIRGIGTQAISATTDPAVAVAFNNTPFVRNHFFEQEFYDLERVEVLRGPQGTLYGRNATAGVVNVISAKPKFRFEAKASGDIANYKSSRIEGMINIPLVEDAVALRVAGAWTKREGFVTNTLTGQQTDGRDLWSGRVSLAVAPNDRFRADLIYEHFAENDDRLRSGKQLCKRDPGPTEIAGIPVPQSADVFGTGANYFSQGCLPASMYSPDAFQVPNGYALPYFGPLGALGGPIGDPSGGTGDPYASTIQSRDLRAIETHIRPEYTAESDLVELQLRFDVGKGLTLSSETGFARDFIFSYQDFNRFNTAPGAFTPTIGSGGNPIVTDDGVFCDPQIGCTDRLAAADIATAKSQQFSQELRLSSDYEGPLNFSVGANFLRYDTEDKYYVFINTLTAFAANGSMATINAPWVPGVSDNAECLKSLSWSDPKKIYGLSCIYIDPNDIHNLTDQGRNYFLSKNPYRLMSYAAFGEMYYNITPDLKVTLGFRWTEDRKTAPQVPSWLLAGRTYGTATRKTIDQEWREPTGRIAIDWKPTLSFTDETLVYGSYVRGYKAGGANPPPPITVLPPVGGQGLLGDEILSVSLTHPETFEAEYIDAFEVGAKNTLADGRLTLNVGAFYYDYVGYQISQIVNRSAVNLNFDAKVWGAELEADWRPLENLRLGLKLGYENSRVADGETAIDLMDRTAGNPAWILMKPFPPQSSNCVLPQWLAAMVVGTFNNALCTGYVAGVDPLTLLPYVSNPTHRRLESGQIVTIESSPNVGGLDLTGYPGFDPASAPNNGEGFAKDLSGNRLPNAPDYTATITADWTLPLPNDWLMTLHTDLYYQSEAWTRIFNTEGYDKLKAYSNINFAAIFTNEDAGWNVMAYVKNVLDRDSITGTFLNSDDTGLTTNVFLTEPRLYGLRVTKSWNGGSFGDGFAKRGSGPYPLLVELGGQVQRQDAPSRPLAPSFVSLFPSEVDPLAVQGGDLDWGDGRSVRLAYRPAGGSWTVSAGVRYGKTNKSVDNIHQEVAVGPRVCGVPLTSPLQRNRACDPEYVRPGFEYLGPGFFYNPGAVATPTDFSDSSLRQRESHTFLDFSISRDVGLGALESSMGLGLRHGRLESDAEVTAGGRAQFSLPEGFRLVPTFFSRHGSEFDAHREFEGAGPTVSWEAARHLFGGEAGGELKFEWSLTTGVLFGKQETTIRGFTESSEFSGIYVTTGNNTLTNLVETPVSIHRTESVTVPLVDARLGFDYEIERVKLGLGYRWERYYDVIDGGFMEHKSYDRQFDGPYFKLSVGFGG